MYCKPASDNVFYFINKVLLFYQYMRNGSRVMMRLCDVKSYINAQFFLSRTEINFYLTPEHNTIFLSELTTYKSAMSTIIFSCLVVGENPYENAFAVEINT